MRILQNLMIALVAVVCGLVSQPASAQTMLDKQIVSDAYVYLLGRALVIRQEQANLEEPDVDYNVVKYNPLGTPLDWVNPNLDVTNIEAWIAVDGDTPSVLEIPRIEGRYFTMQIMDEWAETITSINERNYPLKPYGKFAFVAPGSTADIPDDAVRIELRSNKAKMLGRIELKLDPEGAVALQQQVTITSLGTPNIPPAVSVPSFNNRDLIGVELFDFADAILASAPDVSPFAAQLQVQVRAVAAQAQNPDLRPALDTLIREEVIPEFQRYAVTEAGVQNNNWIGTTVVGNYGEDYDIRTAANYVGIWANARHEVIYFVTTRDADGNPLNGDSKYVIDFPAQDQPDNVTDAYWSLSLVDVPGYLAVKNDLDRYSFNSVAPPELSKDGSLKIYLASASGPDVPEANWLPAPADKDFSLTFRVYVPKDIVKRGEWFPPAIKKLN